MPSFGSNATLGLTRQNSLGATAPSSWFKYPFANCNIDFAYAELTDDSITGIFDEPDRVPGIGGVTGQIEGNLQPIMAGHIFRGLFSANSTAAIGSGFTHTFLPNTVVWSPECSNQPYSFFINAGEAGVNSSYLFQDVFIDTAEISVAAGGYIRLRASLLGKSSGLITSPTPVQQLSVRPFVWSSVSLSIGGAGVAKFSDIRFMFNNNLAAQDRIDGTQNHAFFFREGFRQFARFSGTVDITQSDWMAMRAASETSVSLYALGITSISSGVNEYLKVDIPRAVFTKYPINIPGPGIITIGLEGRGMLLSTSGRVCSVTLQNTMSTYV